MLMLLYWGLPCFLILMGIFVFVFNRKHLLPMLLSLEYIVLSLFFFVIYLLKFNGFWEMF